MYDIDVLLITWDVDPNLIAIQQNNLTLSFLLRPVLSNDRATSTAAASRQAHAARRTVQSAVCSLRVAAVTHWPSLLQEAW